MKKMAIFCCGIMWVCQANSQTVNADLVTPNEADKFTYDNKDMPHYALKWLVDSWATGGLTAWMSGFSGIKFFTQAQPRMVINGTGNVGIGTTSPAYKMHIHSDATTQMAIGSASNGYAGSLLFYEQNNIVGKAEMSYWGQNPNSYGLTNKMSFIGNNTNNTAYTNFEFGRYSSNDGYFPLMTIDANTTNVGVGTTTPASKLVVNGAITTGNFPAGTSGSIYFGNNNHGIRRVDNSIELYTSGAIDKAFSFTTRNYNPATQDYSLATEALTIRGNGNVGIGTTTPSELLSVNGNIRTRKVIVTQTGWPDYVFDSSYQLPSLDSVASFVQVNKHLPDMPSAVTIEKDGQDIGDVQKQLLKKVEELTLYVIELKKDAELSKKRTTQLEDMNQKLLNRVSSLEKNN